MPVANVTTGEFVTEAWGDSVADALNALTATWTSYTPTLVQSGAVTKTVTYAKYLIQGARGQAKIRLDATGAGTVANAVTIGLPTTAASSTSIMGFGSLYDASAPLRYLVQAVGSTTSAFTLIADNQASSSSWGVSPSIALANGDVIIVDVSWEVP